jgi:signal transduction histidine kinase
VTRRLLVGYLSLALVVLVALEVPLAVSYRRSELNDLTAKVERDAVAVASLAEDLLQSSTGSTAPLQRVAARYDADTGGRIVVVDRRGVSLVDAEAQAGRDVSSRPEIAGALNGNVETGTRYSTTLGHGLLYVAVPVASGGRVHGAVRITYPTSELDQRVHRYWLTLAAIGGIILALTAAVGVVVARWVARPLLALERTARKAGEGDLSARADETRGPPEVRSLAMELNVMVREVEQLMDSQRDFVADASHQLRTPLTALRLRLENLSHELSADGRLELEAATVEAERLERIVDGLLVLARTDVSGPATAPIGVAAVVTGRLDAWSAFAAEREVGLDASVPSDATACAAEDRLEQVLDNLLANALDVAPPGTTIEVVLRDDALHVLDRGPGMTEAELRHAFDRFWRAGGGEGSGLGLAIVRRLVEADGGSITLRRREGGGLDAAVSLRRAATGRRESVREPAFGP